MLSATCNRQLLITLNTRLRLQHLTIAVANAWDESFTDGYGRHMA